MTIAVLFQWIINSPPWLISVSVSVDWRSLDQTPDCTLHASKSRCAWKQPLKGTGNSNCIAQMYFRPHKCDCTINSPIASRSTLIMCHEELVTLRPHTGCTDTLHNIIQVWASNKRKYVHFFLCAEHLFLPYPAGHSLVLTAHMGPWSRKHTCTAVIPVKVGHTVGNTLPLRAEVRTSSPSSGQSSWTSRYFGVSAVFCLTPRRWADVYQHRGQSSSSRVFLVLSVFFLSSVHLSVHLLIWPSVCLPHCAPGFIFLPRRGHGVAYDYLLKAETLEC